MHTSRVLRSAPTFPHPVHSGPHHTDRITSELLFYVEMCWGWILKSPRACDKRYLFFLHRSHPLSKDSIVTSRPHLPSLSRNARTCSAAPTFRSTFTHQDDANHDAPVQGKDGVVVCDQKGRPENPWQAAPDLLQTPRASVLWPPLLIPSPRLAMLHTAVAHLERRASAREEVSIAWGECVAGKRRWWG